MAENPNPLKKKRQQQAPIVVVGPNQSGKLPPHSNELEREVLGALMLDSKLAFARIQDILKPESFYSRAHSLIFAAIQALVIREEPADMLTVIERLKFEGHLDEVGGIVYVSGLTAGVASSANIVSHAKLIAQKAVGRQLISIAAEIEEKVYDEQTDVADLINDAEGSIFKLSQQSQKRDVEQIDPIIKQAIKHMAEAGKKQGNISGLATGFSKIDKVTSGWQNSDLIIIAARPAMGKTAFVMSMIKNMAVDYNTPVAIFSLEMSREQLVNRLIMNVCELEGDKVRSGKLSQSEWTDLDRSIQALMGAPIYVDDTPSLSILEFRSKARRLKNEHNIQCIVIDYLQLMNASGMQTFSREQEVSTISRSLKGMAKELNIPIIALSQLNRSVESRGDKGIDGKRPQLSDLRESGAIEQDADMVCFIHRPEYYKLFADSAGNDLHGVAQFLIAKHRNGATEDINLRFEQVYAKFSDMKESDFNNAPADYAHTTSSLGNKRKVESATGAHQEAHPTMSPDGATETGTPF